MRRCSNIAMARIGISASGFQALCGLYGTSRIVYWISSRSCHSFTLVTDLYTGGGKMLSCFTRGPAGSSIA